MGSTVSAVKRVQFRLRAEDKGLLQLAASYEGESLSAFIRKAALEAACSVFFVSAFRNKIDQLAIVNHFTGFTDFFHFVLNVVGQGGAFDDSDSLVNHKVVDFGRFAAYFHLNLSVYGNHVAAFARAHQADVDAAQTVAVAPDFLKTQSAVRVPEDLQKRPIIAERSGRTLMLGKDESAAIWVEPTMRVNNAGAPAAALAGAGYAVGVPLWQISSHLKTGKLELVLENWRIAARPVWLLKHPHTEHNTHIRRLEQYLIECRAQTEGLDAARRTFARMSLTDAH